MRILDMLLDMMMDLELLSSANCGTSWDSIYGAFGSDLQTVAYESGSWSPTCGSWKSDSINLSDFGLNGDTLMFRFTAINDYGNNFYLDNINVNGQNILEISETHLFEQTSIYQIQIEEYLT